MANKKLRSDVNCERRNSKRFHSSQMDKVVAKNAKIGIYVLQMEKSRNDRHQSPDSWLGFLQNFSV